MNIHWTHTLFLTGLTEKGSASVLPQHPWIAYTGYYTQPNGNVVYLQGDGSLTGAKVASSSSSNMWCSAGNEVSTTGMPKAEAGYVMEATKQG